jgi:hypothetical protein
MQARSCRTVSHQLKYFSLERPSKNKMVPFSKLWQGTLSTLNCQTFLSTFFLSPSGSALSAQLRIRLNPSGWHWLLATAHTNVDR